MNGGGGGRRFFGISTKGRKDKDEELLLFRELHKRENERGVSLLQPVSDEFEPHAASAGNYPFYRIPSAKKGSGLELLADQNGKNDYDWLKTPPATPLFPSLEMEAPAPEFVIQREIPIIQPISQVRDGNSDAPKASNGRPKSQPANPKVPLRATTPSQRPSSTESKTGNKGTPIVNKKPVADISKRANAVTNAAKSTNQKESHMDLLIPNSIKNIGTHSKTKPRSRAVSPLVRSTIPAQIPEFSNETPPNLRTDRSTSVTRGRSGNPIPPVHQKPEPPSNPRADRSTSITRGRPGNPILPVSHKPEPSAKSERQSCSPSVRRKMESQETSQGNVTGQKGRLLSGNGTHVLGSRMVEKVMNARKSGAEGRESKTKSRGSISENSGFGRMVSKSSLDIASKHSEIKRDRTHSSHLGVVPGRRFSRENLE
ncbi:hypothetical protein CJ030_MR2G016184 [Morella rubra]|uniref:Uncharacterized protein n=1 Tax=Morella rubra TaxID=262757 RepID=A0A6A1WBN9_9ROSI|nr:hypothetical protein CJ030_MR2G016184 [Morella rubra]